MRRLLLFGLAVVLSGLIVASASALDVDGGALQAFLFGVELPEPITTSTTLVVDSTSTSTTTAVLEASSTTTSTSWVP